MSVTAGQTFGVVGPNTTSTTLAVPVPSAIPAGMAVVLATNKAPIGAGISGVSTITDNDSNAWVEEIATSVRASGQDLTLNVVKVTDTIEAADNLTVTVRSSSNRLLASGVVFDGLTDTVLVGSGSSAGGVAGNTSAGINGSASPATYTLSGVPAGALVVVAAAFGGAGTTITPVEAGWVATPAQGTAYGSSERNVQVFYKVSSGGSETFTGTLAPSGSWALVAAALAPVAAPSGGSGVVVGGSKKAIAARSVVVGGAKKAVAKMWVVVNGVKHPIA